MEETQDVIVGHGILDVPLDNATVLRGVWEAAPYEDMRKQYVSIHRQ